MSFSTELKTKIAEYYRNHPEYHDYGLLKFMEAIERGEIEEFKDIDKVPAYDTIRGFIKKHLDWELSEITNYSKTQTAIKAKKNLNKDDPEDKKEPKDLEDKKDQKKEGDKKKEDDPELKIKQKIQDVPEKKVNKNNNDKKSDKEKNPDDFSGQPINYNIILYLGLGVIGLAVGYFTYKKLFASGKKQVKKEADNDDDIEKFAGSDDYRKRSGDIRTPEQFGF